jgi:hypothetical protein
MTNHWIVTVHCQHNDWQEAGYVIYSYIHTCQSSYSWVQVLQNSSHILLSHMSPRTWRARSLYICHFGWNGSNFLGYRLLKTFQSLETMLVYLGFEVAPEKKIARGQIWRIWRPPIVTTQGDNMPRKHFSKNFEWTTRCVVCCTIFLKLHIFCSVFIEKIIQFRPEKVP